MKNFKRVLAMTTAAVMAVTSFAGCSSNSANSGNVGGSTNVAEGEKTIVIGGSGPLTGDAAQYGVGVKNAIQLAVNEVNAAGGVNGNKLKLVFEDDEADSGDKAVNAYNTLKDQGMQIFLGTVTTASCLAVVDKSKQDNIFQFTPSASAQDVIANDNCFQICFTDPNQGKVSADYIADKDSVLLYEVDKNNKETVRKAKTDPIINMPIIILTNENTASASEILAGALKDLGKAKTVGTTTYGKGVIQQILKLNDGSGLKITIEEYQTPNKNKINKVGIEPDEKVELPDSVESIFTIKESEDTQLQKAIDMLK